MPESAAALRHCSRLEVATFSANAVCAAEHHPTSIPWNTGLTQQVVPGFWTKLRVLRIHSNGLSLVVDIFPRDLELPHLEVSTLTHIVLKSDYGFPVFPRLHTLYLALVGKAPPTFGPALPLEISSSKFVSLKTLYHVRPFTILMIDNACARKLEPLYIYGFSTPAANLVLLDMETTFTGLHHLEMDLPTPHAVLKFPPSLHFLVLAPKFYYTVFIAPSGTSYDVAPDALHILYQSLSTRLPACPMISMLRLHLYFLDNWDLPGLDRDLRAIRELCRSCEANFQAQHWLGRDIGWIEYNIP